MNTHMYLQNFLRIVTGIVFIWFLMVIPYSVFGQKIILETDKSIYEYGETIEVHVSVYNDTDSSFTLVNNSGDETWIGINDVKFNRVGIPSVNEYLYAPGVKRTFIWLLKPDKDGVPERNGMQKIYGYIHGSFKDSNRDRLFAKDSVVIEAPIYYGGITDVSFNSGVSEIDRQAIRDSVGAVVIEEGRGWQQWQIEGHSIDSLASEFADDPRFKFFIVNRMLSFPDRMIVSTSIDMEEIPLKYQLRQNFPNPFNPSTKIRYSVPQQMQVKLEVYNVIGQKVMTLVNEEKSAGHHEVNFDATNLSSGVYLYRLQADRYSESKQMLLMK